MNNDEIRKLREEIKQIHREFHQLNIFMAHIAGVLDTFVEAADQNKLEEIHSS